jgi:hypothetical protein
MLNRINEKQEKEKMLSKMDQESYLMYHYFNLRVKLMEDSIKVNPYLLPILRK